MNKFLRTLFLCMLTAVTLTVSARAAENTLRVGLNYGSSALYSANLQNFQGSGYHLGWFDESTGEFVPAGYLTQEKISMTADGTIYISGGSYYASRPGRVDDTAGGYHVQLEETFRSFEEAERTAGQLEGAFPAFINNVYRVRVGSFTSREEAEVAAATYATYGSSGTVTAPSATAVTVTVTTTSNILFQFDCSGAKSLGVLPDGGGGRALTWFRGYKWYGGFEYRRSTGGNLNVINVVDVDDYLKGVLPYEMSPTWPIEALKAQAVCARTYALLQTKHSSYGFDVCAATDCQVYQGANQASALTDRAVEETAGVVALYGGKYAETYYYASNGGASESSENVWSMSLPYLMGKEDPYEGTISIPDYAYTINYSYGQLGEMLRDSGYRIGTVSAAYVSRTTPTGNVAEVTFRDTSGNTVVITREACRWVLGTKSMRFTISGGGGGGSWRVNPSGDALASLKGAFVIGSAGVSAWDGGEACVITASGTAKLQQPASVSGSGSGITITGTGWGHGVGMSQYGAKAMAELGYSWEDILQFYFTGITLGQAG